MRIAGEAIPLKRRCGVADGSDVRARRSKRPTGSSWLLLARLFWAAQMAILHQHLGRPKWNEYWRWRGVYRPGLQAVNAAGGEYLPGYVFDPLSATGAMWGFALSAGVYALVATVALWTLWRAMGRRRQGFVRGFRRELI